MRLIAFVEYAAVVVGIIGMIAGRFFALPKGFDLGVFLIGAGIALGGIEALLTQRMSSARRRMRTRTTPAHRRSSSA